jgi:hypothetical protein
MSAPRLLDRMLAGGILLAIIAAAPCVAQAAGLLTEAGARAAAIKILMGDPYGKNAQEVGLNLSSSELIMSGNTKCGGKPTASPVWQFHVVVPASRNPNPGGNAIDGYLLLDARNGKMKCAGLPFLD